MVILRKLYSVTDLFDPIDFHLGINIIRGVYTASENEKKDLSGIGKSTSIRLIDFSLLSDSKNHFSGRKHQFLREHSVSLDFEIDGISYTVQRSFENPDSPLFGITHQNLERYEISELRSILGMLFFGQDNTRLVYYENTWFRDLCRFFIKDDITNLERKDPINFVHVTTRKSELYAYNLFLLGLPNASMVKFNELSQKLIDFRKDKRKLISRLEEDTGKQVEEIDSEIYHLDNKIASFEKSISEYKFLKSYEDVEKELIAISGEISVHLRKLTSLERKLIEYKKSYEVDIEVDSQTVVKIYREIRNVFGDLVKKQLDDVITFRNKLSENRKQFLVHKELELTQEIDDLKSLISLLEERRSSFYRLLDERNALDSIKNTYQLAL